MYVKYHITSRTYKFSVIQPRTLHISVEERSRLCSDNYIA